MNASVRQDWLLHLIDFASKMPSNAAAADAHDAFRFWELPPELRDMIYRFAYSDKKPYEVVIKSKWYRVHDEKACPLH